MCPRSSRSCPSWPSSRVRSAVVLALPAIGSGRGGLPAACPGADRVPAGAAGRGLAFLLVVGLWYATRLRVSGDEPHYLLMAQSLWRERDLDLARQLERRGLARVHAGPGRAALRGPARGRAPVSRAQPGPGLPAGAALRASGDAPLRRCPRAGRGARSLELWRAARRLTGDDEAALLAWGLALGPPVAFYSFHDLHRGAVGAGPGRGAAAPPAGPAVPGARSRPALASALPWLHLKMIPAAVALAVVAALACAGARCAGSWPAPAVMAAAFLA